MITASVTSLVDSKHARVGSRLRLRRCSSTSSLSSVTRPVPGSDTRTDDADDSSDDECIPIVSDVFLEGDEGRRDPVPVPESVPLLLRMHMWIFQYNREKGRIKQLDVGSSRSCSPTTPPSSKPFTDTPEGSLTTTMEEAVVDHTRALHASHSLPPYQQPPPSHQQPPPPHQKPPPPHQQPPPSLQHPPPPHQQPPPHPKQKPPPSYQQPPPPSYQQPPPPHQQPPPFHPQPPPPHQKPPPPQQPPPPHQKPPPPHQKPPPSHQKPPPSHQKPPPSHQQPPSDQLPPPHQQEQTEFHQRATVHQQQPPQSQQTSQEQTGLSQQPVAHSQTKTKENVFWCGIDGSDSTPLRSKPPLSRKPSKKEKKEVIQSNQRETEQPKDNHQEWRLSEHGFDNNDKENDRHFGSHLEEETEGGSYGMRKKQDIVTISQDLLFDRSRGVHKVHQEASSTRGRAVEMPPKSRQTPSSTKGTQPQLKRHQHPHSGKSDESHQSARKRNDRNQMRSGEKKCLTVNQTSEKQTLSDQSKNPWSHNGPTCYIAPKVNSNKKLIRNAVSVVCLAGSANIDKRVSALQELDEKGGNHCLILFKDNAGSIKFKALYNYFPEEDEARRIYGIGPKTVSSHMAAKFYKYNSGKRDFEEVATKTLSIRISGFTLKSSHQKK